MHAGGKLLETRVQLGGERVGKGVLHDSEKLVVFRVRQQGLLPSFSMQDGRKNERTEDGMAS